MRKLKLVKEKVKCWNRVVFGNLESSKKEVMSRIGELDALELQGALAEPFRRERLELRLKLEELTFRELVSWAQKAKIKWLMEGDVNSIFFYKVADGQRKKKFIKRLEISPGVMVEKENQIVSGIYDFYSKLYLKEEVKEFHLHEISQVLQLGNFTVVNRIRALIWKIQLLMSLHLPSLLIHHFLMVPKMFYCVNAFELLVSQDWNLGVMPVHIRVSKMASLLSCFWFCFIAVGTSGQQLGSLLLYSSMAAGVFLSLLSFFFSSTITFGNSIYSANGNPWRGRGRTNVRQNRAEFLSRSGMVASRGTLWNSPRRPSGWSDSPVKGMISLTTGRVTKNQQDYFSTFHRTPNRKKFSKKEWENFTQESTRHAVAELASFPKFTDWIIKHADRIQLLPDDSSDNTIGSGSDSTDENLVESGDRFSLCKW
ncbi:hypothetical protein ACSBR2_020448 [Camellia fascicularis]